MGSYLTWLEMVENVAYYGGEILKLGPVGQKVPNMAENVPKVTFCQYFSYFVILILFFSVDTDQSIRKIQPCVNWNILST